MNVPVTPTAPIARAIGTRRNVSASITMNASSASVKGSPGRASNRAIVPQISEQRRRKRPDHVHPAGPQEERHHRVNEGRQLDLEDGRGIAVAGGLARLVPEQDSEAEGQGAGAELDP